MHYSKRKKPGLKGDMLHDSICMTFWKRQTCDKKPVSGCQDLKVEEREGDEVNGILLCLEFGDGYLTGRIYQNSWNYTLKRRVDCTACKLYLSF